MDFGVHIFIAMFLFFADPQKMRLPTNLLIEIDFILFRSQLTSKRLNEVAERVARDVARGKELHADEQAPAFLYSDVLKIEKLWEVLETAAQAQYSHVLVSC